MKRCGRAITLPRRLRFSDSVAMTSTVLGEEDGRSLVKR
jgi:hypothetical protein